MNIPAATAHDNLLLKYGPVFDLFLFTTETERERKSERER